MEYVLNLKNLPKFSRLNGKLVYYSKGKPILFLKHYSIR